MCCFSCFVGRGSAAACVQQQGEPSLPPASSSFPSPTGGREQAGMQQQAQANPARQAGMACASHAMRHTHPQVKSPPHSMGK